MKVTEESGHVIEIEVSPNDIRVALLRILEDKYPDFKPDIATWNEPDCNECGATVSHADLSLTFKYRCNEIKRVTRQVEL